jgi:hypothetical protein
MHVARMMAPHICPSLAGLDPAIPIGATIGLRPTTAGFDDSMRRPP